MDLPPPPCTDLNTKNGGFGLKGLKMDQGLKVVLKVWKKKYGSKWTKMKMSDILVKNK